MLIRKAAVDDIDLLVRLRLDYIRADWGSLTAEDEEAIVGQLRPYLIKYLPAGDFVGMLALEGETVMAAAYMVISEKPANPTYPNGITGLILNVLTYPMYRRRGDRDAPGRGADRGSPEGQCVLSGALRHRRREAPV